jgi:HAD superfamily hydrolase (TIGR01509 family)
MIKGIIFDCFGVLVGRGFENTYRTAGGDPNGDREFIDDMLGKANMGLISDDEFRAGMADKLGIDAGEWRNLVKSAEQPDIDLLNFVKKMRLQYKTALLSNANKGSVERKIGEAWLKSCFDAVVVSAEIGMVKPDPRIYYSTAKKLGLPASECVFIDDAQIYVDGAKTVGMHAILYRGLESLKTDLETLLANPES